MRRESGLSLGRLALSRVYIFSPPEKHLRVIIADHDTALGKISEDSRGTVNFA
jgi:hypothetical protein